jgi:uncharacterized protein (TIGR02271 family)
MMLDKLFGGDDRNENEAAPQDRDLRIREMMRAQGVTEEEATRLILSEEELTVGKRAVHAGEVEVTKRVETEHVQQPVTLRHDEVEVERRPITDGFAATGATIGEGEEIRIPLQAEQAVVEKHIVPREEVVVRTREVTDTEMVEADVRREHADVHREGAVRETDQLRSDPSLGRDDRLG